MADEVGNTIPAPGFYEEVSVDDDELLYSTARFTQKGVTLAAGLGILPIGTVLGRVTATKLWVPYTDGATHGAGSDTARGVLRRRTDTGTDANGKRLMGNIVISGILKNDKVSGATASAITDLGARVDTVLNTFTF